MGKQQCNAQIGMETDLWGEYQRVCHDTEALKIYVKSVFARYNQLLKELAGDSTSHDLKAELSYIQAFLLDIMTIREIHSEEDSEIKEKYGDSIHTRLLAMEQIYPLNNVKALESTRMGQVSQSNKRCFIGYIPGLDNMVLSVAYLAFFRPEDLGEKVLNILPSDSRFMLSQKTENIYQPRVATFYSVSASNIPGQKLIHAAQALMKKTMEALSGDIHIEGIQPFDYPLFFTSLAPLSATNHKGATVSFVQWVQRKQNSDTPLLTAEEEEFLHTIGHSIHISGDTEEILERILGEPDNILFHKKEKKRLGTLLEDLALEYLFTAQDGVTDFHLNGSLKGGAFITGVHAWASDHKTLLQSSAGVMVNYSYTPLKDALRRAEAYDMERIIYSTPDIIERFNDRIIQREIEQNIRKEVDISLPSEAWNIAILPHMRPLKESDTQAGIGLFRKLAI